MTCMHLRWGIWFKSLSFLHLARDFYKGREPKKKLGVIFSIHIMIKHQIRYGSSNGGAYSILLLVTFWMAYVLRCEGYGTHRV
jgi:hypothetical protein